MRTDGIRIHLDQESSAVILDPETVRRLAAAVQAREGGGLRVAVHVVGDERMRELHARHLGVEETTDVISFDLRGGDDPEPCPEDVDGEIFVNAPMAVREARSRGHDPRTELLFYVAHGLYHLLGYDDATPEARAAMLDRQAACLADLGLKMEADWR